MAEKSRHRHSLIGRTTRTLLAFSLALGAGLVDVTCDAVAEGTCMSSHMAKIIGVGVPDELPTSRGRVGNKPQPSVNFAA